MKYSSRPIQLTKERICLVKYQPWQIRLVFFWPSEEMGLDFVDDDTGLLGVMLGSLSDKVAQKYFKRIDFGRLR